MPSARLFVYGSLMRGERHHAELKNAPFLGKARTAAGYAIEMLGEYRALVERPGAASDVSGELYEVTEGLLRELDEFEGPDYRRAVVALSGPDINAKNAGNESALAYLKRTR